MAVTIESTTEYGKFKSVKGNRDVSRLHMLTLKKMIEKDNMLAYNPIVVNKAFEVIDGQHRLEAAKELGEPIYYIVSPSADIDEVIAMNANSKVWGATDYLNSYADRG